MSCFHLSNGAFGNKNGSWVLGLVGLMEEAPLDWSKLRGFARESLGEPPTLKLGQTGHNSEEPIYESKTYILEQF